jgi:hypothetical protein
MALERFVGYQAPRVEVAWVHNLLQFAANVYESVKHLDSTSAACRHCVA